MDAQRNVHTVRSTGNQSSMPYQSLARVEDGEFRNAGVFGEVSWPLSDAQRIVSGVRFDQWEAQDSRTSLAIGMGAGAVNPTAGRTRSTLLTSGFGRWERDVDALDATVYAGVGHVERFPDYWELLSAGREAADSISAFDTQPEKTTQLDTGFVYRASRLELSLAAFYNQIDNYILIQSNYRKGMRRANVARNVDASTFGAEADAAYAIGGGWKVIGTLAYTRGDNETDDVPLAQLAPLEARLGVNYERGAWSFGTLARWVADQERFALDQGNIVGQDLGRTDDFATLALNTTWRSGRGIMLSAGVDNVFDRLYAEHLSRSGAMLAGYTQTTRVNEAGRTLWLRLSADFE
jgi:iron complex outermembrane receptor protein